MATRPEWLINTPHLPRLGDRGLQCTFIPWQRPHFLLQFLISHSDWQASSEYPSQLSWSLAAQGPDQKFDTGVRPLSQNNSFPPTPNSHGPHSQYLSQHMDPIRSLTQGWDHSNKMNSPTSHTTHYQWYLLQHRDLIRSLTLESDHSPKITPFPPPPPPKEHTPLFGLNIDVPLNCVWFSRFNVVGVPSKWEQEEKKMVSLLLFALVSSWSTNLRGNASGFNSVYTFTIKTVLL